MFTSKKRVIRDGYLVAFEGEVMTDDEAVARGLVKTEKKPRAKTPQRGTKTKAKAEPAEGEAVEEES